MSVTRTVISPVTKRQYYETLKAMFFEAFWFYQRFAKGKGTLDGELLQCPIKLRLNPTGAAVAGRWARVAIPGQASWAK